LAKWIKCMSRSDNKTEVYITLARASWIIPEKDGSRMCFPGGKDKYYDVTEKPQEIIAKADPHAPRA